MPILHHLFCEL